MDCSNYRGISLLSAIYKIFSIILLSRLTPKAEEIIGDYQCGFQHNRSTTDRRNSLLCVEPEVHCHICKHVLLDPVLSQMISSNTKVICHSEQSLSARF
jgi:hypothetical protein